MGGGTVTIGNSLVATNSVNGGTGGSTGVARGPDVYGTFSSGDFNLIGILTVDASGFNGAADQAGSSATPLDAKLDSLGAQNNGGALPTVRLRKGSPAVDKGKDLVGGGTDEVGNTRPHDLANGTYPNASGGDGSDIGAFESQSLPNDVPVSSDTTINDSVGTTFSSFAPATDGDSDTLTYSVVSGTMPAGLTFHSDGTVTGTPTAAGQNVQVTFKANDGLADSNVSTITFNILEAGSPVVTTDIDTSTMYDGLTSMREAVAYAAAHGGTATFDPTFFATAKTITLASPIQLADAPLTLTGPATGVTISGGDATQLFSIYGFGGSSAVQLNNLTLAHGQAPSGGALILLNFGSAPAVTLTNCTLSNNGADGGAGGTIYNQGGTLTLVNCTLAGNHSNTGGSGGAIYATGGTTTLDNCTLSLNQATTGGAIKVAGGTLTLGDSIVAGNTAGTGTDISGTVASLGYNIIGNSTGATITGTTTGNHLDADPGLDAGGLAANGGPTQTIALSLSSLAVDQGKALGSVTTDQRGQVRPKDISTIANASGGDGSDIGAFELIPPAPTVTSPASSALGATSVTLSGNVTSDGGSPVTERGVVYAVTTTNANPQISGTGVTQVTGSGTTGAFSIPITGLSPSTGYSYAAYATNANGTGYTSAGTFTTLAGPAIVSVTAPANGTYKAGDVLSFTVTFTSVVNVTGSPTLAITVGGTGRTATYSTGTGSTALVFTYTVALGDNAPAGIAVSSPLVLAGGTIQDGSSLDAGLTFTPPVTTSVLISTVPVVTTSGGNTAFVEGDNVALRVAVDGSLTVTDPSHATLTSGTVAITGNLSTSEDVLALTVNASTMGNIAPSYSAGTGVLTLTSSGGTATLAQWQAALRAVTYTDTALLPSNAPRTISFTVNDGVQDSATSTKTVTVTATEQSALVTTSSGATSFLPGAPVVIDAALTLTDLDNTTSASATVAITTAYQSGEDVLAFTNDGTTMGNIAVTTNVGGVLTLTSAGATATLAEWRAALRAVTYNDPAAVPVTTNRVITFIVNDGTKDGAAKTKTIAFVPPVTPTITWATPAAMTYGTQLSLTHLSATATVSGNPVAGAFVYNFGIGTVLEVGSQTLSLTFTPTNLALYSVATASVTVTVNKATPTLTWATPAAVTYGTTLSSAQLNAAATNAANATVPGAYAYSPASGTTPQAGARTLSVTFMPIDSVHYSSATASVTLTVTPVTPVVTWATPAAISYGTALSATQLNASATVPGAFAYTPAAGTFLPKGVSQTLSVTFTPTDASYATVTGSTTLTVTQGVPTIVWATPATITYGTALSATQLNAGVTLGTLTSVPGTFVYTPAAGPISGGAQTLSVTFTPTDAVNVAAASKTVTLTVNPAAQTITFPALSGAQVGVGLTLGATSTSGLTVTYTVISGNASVSLGQLICADTNAVTVRASQAGNANYQAATSVDRTVTAGNGSTQTITFPNLGTAPHVGTIYTDVSTYTLSATASSGLPVTYSIVSDHAGVVNRILAQVVNGVSTTSLLINVSKTGSVTLRASQAGGVKGGVTYQAATPVDITFTVTVNPGTTYTGGLTGSASAGDSTRSPLDALHLQAVSTGSNFAASLSADKTKGVLLGYLATTSQGFVANLTPDAQGNFTATTTTVGAGTPVALTITGTITPTAVSGTIQPLGITFGSPADPLSGPTAAIAGIYQSPNLNGSSGTTYSLVGTQGQVFVLAVTPTSAASGTGTVTSNGVFSVQTASAVTVAGTIDVTTATVTGTVTGGTGTAVSFSGASNAVSPSKLLVNMSARGLVNPTSPLIVGFVVNGTAPKTVVLRGVGPALASFGLSFLTRPQLSLYNSAGTLVASNAAWGGSADLVAAFNQVGAFGLVAVSTDTALMTTLSAGTYTIVISDALNDAGGTALAEIYDASIDPTETTQSLVNISSRGQVTPATPLLGGFVVQGNTPKRVLIRAIGPGLTAFNVPGALADPVLSVLDGAGNVIAKNDDWGTGQPATTGQAVASGADITTADSSTGAFALTTGSKDSALITTLAPGNYSAVVTGANGTSGAALVEVYELP